MGVVCGLFAYLFLGIAELLKHGFRIGKALCSLYIELFCAIMPWIMLIGGILSMGEMPIRGLMVAGWGFTLTSLGLTTVEDESEKKMIRIGISVLMVVILLITGFLEM